VVLVGLVVGAFALWGPKAGLVVTAFAMITATMTLISVKEIAFKLFDGENNFAFNIGRNSCPQAPEPPFPSMTMRHERIGPFPSGQPTLSDEPKGGSMTRQAALDILRTQLAHVDSPCPNVEYWLLGRADAQRLRKGSSAETSFHTNPALARARAANVEEIVDTIFKGYPACAKLRINARADAPKFEVAEGPAERLTEERYVDVFLAYAVVAATPQHRYR
jgi:hypothetical protein